MKPNKLYSIFLSFILGLITFTFSPSDLNAQAKILTEFNSGTLKVVVFPDHKNPPKHIRIISQTSETADTVLLQPSLNPDAPLNNALAERRPLIRLKRDSLLAAGSLRPLSAKQLQILWQDSTQREAIKFFYSRDWDILLISQLGLEYQNDDFSKLLVEAIDESGTILESQAFTEEQISQKQVADPLSIESTFTGKGKTINMKWSFDEKQYLQASRFVGFHIYKMEDNKWRKLTPSPVQPLFKEGKGQIFYVDKQRDSTSQIYGAAPVTLFGSTSEIFELIIPGLDKKQSLIPVLKIRKDSTSYYPALEMKNLFSGIDYTLERKYRATDPWITVWQVQSPSQPTYFVTDNTVDLSSAMAYYRLRWNSPDNSGISEWQTIQIQPERNVSVSIDSAWLDNDNKLFVRLSKPLDTNFNYFLYSKNREEDKFYMHSKPLQALVKENLLALELERRPKHEWSIRLGIRTTAGLMQQSANQFDFYFYPQTLTEIKVDQYAIRGEKVQVSWLTSPIPNIFDGFRIYTDEKLLKELSPESTSTTLPLELLKNQKLYITAYHGPVESCKCSFLQF